MTYDINKFNSAVRYYQKTIERINKKSILVIYNAENKNAFYSIAPLSRAIHNAGKDLYVMGHSKDQDEFNVLEEIWEVYKKYKKNSRIDEKTASLLKFINFVDKKAKGKFKYIFEKPQILYAKDLSFVEAKKRFSLDYKTNWLVKKENQKKLLETADIIWKEVFNLKKKENIEINFELIPKIKDLDKPLEDFLGSFLIAEAMYDAIKEKCANVKLSASSSRYNVNDYPEQVSELLTTLTGCEYEKERKEEVFEIFKKMSNHFNCDVFKPVDGIFGIFGKGNHGRHIFGEIIGYPTSNGKSKWTSPGQMFMKFSWSPQHKDEKRDPVTRIGFTDTIPIKAFIETCHIDWHEMHRKNQKITNIIDKCEKIVVKGEKSNFVVYLTKGKKRRYAMNSDYDVRTKIDEDYFKRTGKKTGNMGNLPGGESFVTPEYIEGVIYGDVVINIDDSYSLSQKEPLIIRCSKSGYAIEEGPRKILEKLTEKKKEAWEKLIEMEINKSLPQEIIELKKDNFNGIGEFAINTNPNAKLSDYLIINEKIANMMHIALGSGFDADKSSVYHYDIVFNSKKQKLDVYGVMANGRKSKIVENGNFVI